MSDYSNLTTPQLDQEIARAENTLRGHGLDPNNSPDARDKADRENQEKSAKFETSMRSQMEAVFERNEKAVEKEARAAMPERPGEGLETTLERSYEWSEELSASERKLQSSAAAEVADLKKVADQYGPTRCETFQGRTSREVASQGLRQSKFEGRLNMEDNQIDTGSTMEAAPVTESRSEPVSTETTGDQITDTLAQAYDRATSDKGGDVAQPLSTPTDTPEALSPPPSITGRKTSIFGMRRRRKCSRSFLSGSERRRTR